MESSNKEISLLTVLSFFGILAISSFPFYSAVGIALFVFFSLKFFTGIGKSIEIRDLIILIALLQWVVGPILKYHYSQKEIFYYMAVPESEYTSFAVTASILFIVGLYFPGLYTSIHADQYISRIKQLLKQHPNLDLILTIGGLIVSVVDNLAPVSIRFFLFLIGGARFVGLYFLVLSNRKFKWQIFAGVLFWLFIETVRDAIFHELLLWLIFLFIVIAFLYRFDFKRKMMFLIPFLVLMTIIQSVKFYFRQEIAAYSGAMDRATLFTEMVSNELGSGEKTMSVSNLDAAIDRINQGWIVARIMRYTPTYQPFAKGETIISGIQASLLPRFLNPDKAKAGGRDNFERFTGKKLSDNTSMGLSPLGEAYANFGVDGGIIFMFILGLFYNLYMMVIIRLSAKFPSLILWLPLLFLQVVKAETDFVVVFNHLVKATMVVTFIIFLFRRAAQIKI